mmetsp:Transcript_17575/g.29622  ORF Transcript_17575/g.29622 Transcript_17575/m.29622 type:complete len:513 (+) Transcript_17575:49-1587(+)
MIVRLPSIIVVLFIALVINHCPVPGPLLMVRANYLSEDISVGLDQLLDINQKQDSMSYLRSQVNIGLESTPSFEPTAEPSAEPSAEPTAELSASPSMMPTTSSPSTPLPTEAPFTAEPTAPPSSAAPSPFPSTGPNEPSAQPTTVTPTYAPSLPAEEIEYEVSFEMSNCTSSVLDNAAETAVVQSVANVSGVDASDVTLVSYEVTGNTTSPTGRRLWTSKDTQQPVLLQATNTIVYYYTIATVTSIRAQLVDFPEYGSNTTALYQALTSSFSVAANDGVLTTIIQETSRQLDSSILASINGLNVLEITQPLVVYFPSSMPTPSPVVEEENTDPSVIVVIVVFVMVGCALLLTLCYLLIGHGRHVLSGGSSSDGSGIGGGGGEIRMDSIGITSNSSNSSRSNNKISSNNARSSSRTISGLGHYFTRNNSDRNIPTSSNAHVLGDSSTTRLDTASGFGAYYPPSENDPEPDHERDDHSSEPPSLLNRVQSTSGSSQHSSHNPHKEEILIDLEEH